MKKLLFFLISVLISINAFSQVDIQIGNGTTYFNDPLPGWFGWNRSAYLYKSTEINSDGVISAIAFQIQSASSGSNAKIKIYLLETSMTSLPGLSGTNWNALKAGATLVYQSNAFAGSPTGWKTIPLDLVYPYSGINNLMVFVEGEGCTTGGGCSTNCYNHDSPASHWYNRKDTSAPDDNASSVSSTGQEGKRANIKLTIYPLTNFCYPPSQLISSNVTSNSADLSWVTHTTGSSWVVQYKTASETQWSSENIVYSGSYNLQGLIPNTTYNFRVKSICATNESGWNTINFTTLCVPVSTLPLSESFDAYGTGSSAFPSCWYKLTSNAYPYINTTNYTSPGAMYLYTASGTYNYVISPAFDATIPINTLSAFFKLYKGSAAYNITVGVMSDPTNIATFDSIINLTPSAVSTWQTFSVNFANYTGTGHHIAFKVQGFGAVNSMYIDDLEIMSTPACNVPTGVTRTASTFNSMEIDWNNADDANCSGWIIDYKPYDDSVWLSEYTTSHPHTISNLISNVVYRIKVRAVCNSGDTTYTSDIVNYGLPCESISAFPWVEDFEGVWFVGNGYGGTTDSRPWCWYNVNGGASTSYLWRRTTTASYVRSGLASMQMYTGSTTSQLGDWMITPAFTFTGNERIRFWAKGYSTYTDVLSVKIYDVTTNSLFDAAADTSLFVTILPNTVVSAATWTEYEINLSQFVGDYQIAFVRNTIGGNYLNIDDITIDAIPACQRPFSVTTSNIHSDNVQINFIPGNSGDNLWWVYYKPTTATVWDSIQISSNPGILGNLTQNTNYQYYLKTDCSSTLSEATNIYTFLTACAAVSTIPYTENFDTYGSTAGTFPTCWYRPVLYGTTPFPSIVTANVVSSPASLKFQSASATQPTYAITPQLDVDINTLRVLFKLKAESITSSGTMHIGVMSDPSDTSTFELVQIITPTSTNYTNYEIDFANTTLTGTGKHIAFKHVTSAYNYYYWLDDVVVDNIPPCPNVSNVTSTSVSTNSISLNWTFPSNANMGFEVSYANVNSGFDPNLGTIISVPDGTSLPYTISSLTPGQFYSFAVRQACGGAWSNIIIVKTDALPTTLPYSCDFSDAIEQSAWNISNGAATNKFYIGTPNNVNPPISGPNLFISNDNAVSNTYTLNTISTAVASRLIELDGSFGYRIKFDLNIGGESIHDYIKVFLTDPDSNFVGADFKPYYAINTYNGNNQLLTNYNNSYPLFNGYNGTSIVAGSYPREINIPYQGPSGTVKKLVILWTNDVSLGTQPPASIDNISIQTLSCPIQINVATSNLTPTSTDITWVDPSGSTTEWIFKWKLASSSSWTIVSTNAPLYSLPSLTSNSNYNVSVAAVCGSDTSVYTNYSFTTPCEDITIPYTQNFDAASGFPSCWTRKAGASYPATSTSYLVSSPNSLYFYASSTFQYAASPAIDVNVPVNTLQVNFKLFRTTATYTGVAVGVMTDPNDFTTFQQVGPTISTTALSTWEDKTVLLNSYTGTGRYIVLVCSNPTADNAFYLDDFEIITIPSCPRPTQLTVTNIHPNSAELNWLENGTATTWNIEYGPTGFTPGTGTMITGVTTMPYQVSGLNAQTTYQFYVQSDCGGGDLSTWSSVKSFTTACGYISNLPFMDNFDSYGTGESVMPTCWSRINTYTTSVRPYVASGGRTANCLYFYTSTSGTYNIAVMPNMDPSIAINSLRVKFNSKNTLSTDRMIVGVMSDPTQASTFVPVDTIYTQTSSWLPYEVYMSSYTGTGTYIAFKNEYTTGSSYSYIDDLEIDYIPTCPDVTQFSIVSTTTNSISLNWTATINANQGFELAYSQIETGFDPNNATTTIFIPNTDPLSYTVPGLLPAHFYSFAVRQACGGSWSNIIVTTTDGLPAQMPYSCDFSDQIERASWKISNGNATNKFFIGTPSAVTAPMVGDHLFISQNSGIANTYNLTSTSTAITSRLIEFSGAGSYRLQFDLLIGGESTHDYIKVFITDPDTTFVGSNSMPYYAAPAYNLNNQLLTNYNGTAPYFNGYNGSSAIAGSYPQDIIIPNQGPAGSIKRLIILWTNDVSAGVQPPAAIDNISITPITCPKPNLLSSTNSTSSSSTLSWTENGTATSWNIEYGPVGFTQGSGTVVSTTSNPFTISGLSNATCYDFYVQASCSSSDQSNWSNKGHFCTAQITANVPVNIDFETPSGFQIVNNPSRNKWYIGSDTANTVNHTIGGQNALYVSNNNGITNAYSIDSASVVWAYRDIYFTPSTNDYTLSFDWKNNGEGTGIYFYDYINLYIGNPNLPISSSTSTITEPIGSDTLITKLRLQPTWQTASLTLPVNIYSGTTKRIYFMWKNDASSGSQPPAAIDNISITSAGITTCTTPSNLVVNNITSTTATATWTAGGSETQWEIAYKPTASSTWINTIVNTSPSHVLPTLTVNTPYDVKVRAICGAGDSSSYSPIVNFTTAVAPCNTPTGLTVTNITDQSALATWTPGGSETSWQVEYKLVSSTNWTSATTSTPSYSMVSLQSNANYHVRVKAICSSNESTFITPVQFSTTGGVTYTITATSNSFGTINPSGSVIVNAGANQMFTFIPNTDCAIDSLVIDNGNAIPYSLTTYNFSNVITNHSIHAIFRLVGGVDENSLDKMVALYPNPTNSYIEISFNETLLQVKECKVYDIYGKLLTIVPVSTDYTRIDVSDIAAGVYFIHMNSKMGVITKKFVKK